MTRVDWRRTISNSERSKTSCWQYWLFTYGLGLTTRAKPFAAYLGVIWSEVMHRYHQDGAEEATRWLQTAEEEHLGAIGPDFLETMEDTAEAFQTARSMLDRYAVKWANEPLQVLASEKRYVHPLPGPHGGTSHTSFVAILDKLVEINGQLWILEHKTSRGELADWRRLNGYSPQGCPTPGSYRRSWAGRWRASCTTSRTRDGRSPRTTSTPSRTGVAWPNRGARR